MQKIEASPTFSVVALICWSAACATDPASEVVPSQDAGPQSQPDDGAVPLDASVAACSDGTRLSCACGDSGIGTRLCEDGMYGECAECQEPTASGESHCVPGYYEGTATGTYRASSVFDGLFAPFDNQALTKLSFVLEEKGSSEFFYTLGDACVQVSAANPDAGSDPPASFWLSGEVNCSTGLLEGEMRGYHRSAGPDGTSKKFFYKGKIVGRLDLETHSFVDTGYKIIERPVLLGPPPGGEGTWTAELQEGKPPDNPAQTLADCLGEDFPADDEFDEVDL